MCLCITRVWVRPKVVLGLIGVAVAIHLLLPQVGELNETLAAVRTANVDWLLAGLVGSALTYLAAAVSLNGAVAALMGASSPDQKVWSRPEGGTPGQSSTVTNGSVPDRVSWLRSRRT